jgi:hypothetical protein
MAIAITMAIAVQIIARGGRVRPATTWDMTDASATSTDRAWPVGQKWFRLAFRLIRQSGYLVRKYEDARREQLRNRNHLCSRLTILFGPRESSPQRDGRTHDLVSLTVNGPNTIFVH